MKRIFINGIGTNIEETFISTVITRYLEADY